MLVVVATDRCGSFTVDSDDGCVPSIRVLVFKLRISLTEPVPDDIILNLRFLSLRFNGYETRFPVVDKTALRDKSPLL
jgi:hypothetical protein